MRPLLAVLALLLPAVAHAEDTLVVFAASSLTEAFTEIAKEFEAAHPGTEVTLQFAGSQVLRTQIEHGARVDVFASADTLHAEALHRAGLVDEPRTFARNALVVVVPAHHAVVQALAHVARPHTRLVVASTNVPAGRYTSEMLRKIQESGRFGPQFHLRVLANVVSEESNVRAVLAKVALGEADAGFVYDTDVPAGRGHVEAIEIPSALNVAASYPIAVVKGTAHAELAGALVDFVLSPAGQMVMKRHAFRHP